MAAVNSQVKAIIVMERTTREAVAAHDKVIRAHNMLLGATKIQYTELGKAALAAIEAYSVECGVAKRVVIAELAKMAGGITPESVITEVYNGPAGEATPSA